MALYYTAAFLKYGFTVYFKAVGFTLVSFPFFRFFSSLRRRVSLRSHECSQTSESRACRRCRVACRVTCGKMRTQHVSWHQLGTPQHGKLSRRHDSSSQVTSELTSVSQSCHQTEKRKPRTCDDGKAVKFW